MPSVIELAFTKSEKRALLRLRRHAPSMRVWNRATALLLLSAGVAATEILQSLGISRKTLLNWKRRWLHRRHFGLEDAPREGRPAQMSERHIRLLVRTVRRDPRQLGYAFTRWTAPRLAEYIALRTGARVTPAWITELLRRHGFVWRRTKRTIRNLQNRSDTQQAWRALRRLKKGLWRGGPGTNSGSPTESVSSFSP